MSDNRKYIQAQKFTLAGSGISATDTSITLRSFTTPDGETIAMSDIGTLGTGTLGPATSREEAITFTGVTQNGDGTATLTGVTRGCEFRAPYTQNTALRKSHSGNETFILTNTGQFYDSFANKENDETINNEWTFTINPRKGDTTLAANSDDYITKADLLAATLGTVITDQVVISGTAGENLTAGNIAYFKESDQKWWKADADIVGTFDQVVVAVVQTTASANASVNILLQGVDKTQTGLTLGSKYYLSNTAGAISTTPGTTEVFLGWAQTATRFIFDPLGLYQPTSGEKAAMAGTSGTPSSSNKYVTDADTATAATASKVARRLASGDITVPTTPTNTTDASSKAYVDSSSGAVDTTSYVLGESFTGATTPQPAYVVDDLYQFGISNPSVISTSYNEFGFTAGQPEQRALKIIPRANITITSVRLQLAKTGSPTDNVTVEIQTDSSGSPSGTPVTNGTSSTVAGTSLSTTSATEVTLTFSGAALTSGTTYWAVLKRSSSLSGSNYYNTAVLSSGNEYGSFAAKGYTSGTWNTTQGGDNMPFMQFYTSSGKSWSLWKTDSDSTQWLPRQFFGFCTTTGSAGAAATLVKSGVCSGFTSLNVGADYTTSTTAGSITDSGGGVYVGQAISTTEILVPKTKIGDGTITTMFSIASTGGAHILTTSSFRYKLPFNGQFVFYGNSAGSGFANAVYQGNVAGTYTLVKEDSTGGGAGDITTIIPYTRGQYINVYSSSGGTITLSFTPIIE